MKILALPGTQMMAALVILVNLIGADYINAQPFLIGHTTITFTDPARNNRSIPTEIYYPADVAGNNVPVTTSVPDKFPVVGFGHGFLMPWSAYENIWTALAPEGFIVAFPKTEGSILPSHLEFGKDLSFVIDQMTLLGQNSTSLFFNRVDSMNCVMGHSMGGGASFLAAQWSQNVKTMATLAAAETNPSAISAASSIVIPNLLIAGGNDCVTPPPSNQVAMYNSLQSECKTYVSITGGSHCQMANYNFNCSFGELTCSPSPTISRSQQHATINRFLIPWLKYELKGDVTAGNLFDSLLLVDPEITFQKNCVLVSNIEDPSSFSAIPSGSSQINLSWNRNSFSQEVMLVYDTVNLFGIPVNGIQYFPGNTLPGGGIVIYLGPAQQYSHQSLSPGTTYYYRIFSHNGAYTWSNGSSTDATTGQEGKVLLLSLFPEGLYSGFDLLHKTQNEAGDQFPGNIADMITVELHQPDNYQLEYSFSPVALTTIGQATVLLPITVSGFYYLTILHRNSIETVSAFPVSFDPDTLIYAFDHPSKVYGGNLKLVGTGQYVIFSGDTDQDDLVDSSDMIMVDNAVSDFATGYLVTDTNGDGLVDSTDMILVDNNSTTFTGVILP